MIESQWQFMLKVWFDLTWILSERVAKGNTYEPHYFNLRLLELLRKTFLIMGPAGIMIAWSWQVTTQLALERTSVDSCNRLFSMLHSGQKCFLFVSYKTRPCGKIYPYSHIWPPLVAIFLALWVWEGIRANQDDKYLKDRCWRSYAFFILINSWRSGLSKVHWVPFYKDC